MPPCLRHEDRARPCRGPAFTARPLRAADVPRLMPTERCLQRVLDRRQLHRLHRGRLPRRAAAGADGRLIGYWLAMPGVDEMHLLNITVAPEFQRQGWAVRMLDRLIACMRSQRLNQLWLEVRVSNTRAQDVYLRYGFTQVGRPPTTRQRARP